jgi:hypothetical protein
MKSRFSLLLAVALFVAPVMIVAEGSQTDSANTEKIVDTNLQTDNKGDSGKAGEDLKKSDDQDKPKDESNTSGKDTTKKEDKKEDKKDEDKSTVVSPEAKAGIFAAVTAFITARRANVNDGLDKVAAYSFDIVLKKLASFDCLKGGKFQNSIPTINRVLVSAAAVAILYAAYKVYKGQQDTSEDFDTDFDVDNN